MGHVDNARSVSARQLFKVEAAVICTLVPSVDIPYKNNHKPKICSSRIFHSGKSASALIYGFVPRESISTNNVVLEYFYFSSLRCALSVELARGGK